MSLSLDTVFQIVEVVQKAVEIHKRIKDAPDTIRKLGRRMERLETVLESLEAHLRSKKKHALALLRPAQTDSFLRTVDDTRDDCGKVYVLFEKWEKRIGPLGLQFRGNPFAQYIAEAYFTLGSSMKELESLAADIDIHHRDIQESLGLMGVQGIQENHLGIQAMRAEIKALHELLRSGGLLNQPAITAVAPDVVPSAKPAAKSVTKPAAKPAGKPAANAAAKPATKPDIVPEIVSPGSQKGGSDKGRPASVAVPRPPPSPKPLKRDYKIIFIDPHDLGRSVCAAALTKLYRAWTLQTGGDWRIDTMHSAGFFSKNRSDCGDIINELNYKFPTYKLNMSEGGKPPHEMAMKALFNNKGFDFLSARTNIKDTTVTRLSRGMQRKVFMTYDYILVMTGREHDNMLKLRAAVVAADGKDATPKGKGRVVHLGQYLASDGIPKEIYDPPKEKDGTASRDSWNQKISQLKIAVRGFLKKEMEWKQPDKRQAA